MIKISVCKSHRWTRPKDCFYVVIETLGVNVDNNPIGGEKNMTAAAFLPKLQTVTYTISETSSHCIEQYFMKNDTLLQDFTEKLFVSEIDHICFIIFIYQWENEPNYEYNHTRFLSRILESLKLRLDIF